MKIQLWKRLLRFREEETRSIDGQLSFFPLLAGMKRMLAGKESSRLQAQG